MKGSWKISAFGLVVLALLVVGVGCAKAPTEDIEKAKATTSAAVAGDGAKYAPAESKALQDSLNKALDEVKAQDEKWFKNYDNAKNMLTKVSSDAEALKGTVAKKKEEAKQKATALLAEDKAAVEDAKKLLAKAPKGKGSKADIEAMKSDVKGLEEGLAEVQKLIDGGNFLDAVTKAQAIKDKAASVSEQVKSAMAKTGAKPAKK
jgi:DNA repair exonuclease SbcCD ATPase subunit